VVAATSETLMLYAICCLGVLRLRTKNVAETETPFLAPGGALVPLLASAIIVWMLSTLAWKELFSALALVAISAIVYAVKEQSTRRAAVPRLLQSG